MRIQSGVGRILFFALAAGALCYGLIVAYKAVMLSLPAPVKRASVEMVAYRERLLTGMERNPTIPVPGNTGSAQRMVAMTAFPLLMADKTVLAQAHEAYGDMQAEQARRAAFQVTRAWPQYQERSRHAESLCPVSGPQPRRRQVNDDQSGQDQIRA
jgi:hypothetical protein